MAEKVGKRPFDVYAKAPDKRTVVNHTLTGDSTTVFDNGQEGWIAAPKTDSPVPVVPLTGPDLNSIRVDAALSFPAHLKEVSPMGSRFRNTINDKEVQVVQGISAAGTAAHVLFRFKDRFAGPSGAVHRVADRSYPDTNRLLRLPRCCRDQDAGFKPAHNLAGWPCCSCSQTRSKRTFRSTRRSLPNRLRQRRKRQLRRLPSSLEVL